VGLALGSVLPPALALALALRSLRLEGSTPAATQPTRAAGFRMARATAVTPAPLEVGTGLPPVARPPRSAVPPTVRRQPQRLGPYFLAAT